MRLASKFQLDRVLDKTGQEMQQTKCSLFLTKSILLLSTGLLLCSCGRSSRQMLEDSKTASHYSAKALRSLGGKHEESRQVNSDRDFGWEVEQQSAADSPVHVAALDEDSVARAQEKSTNAKKHSSQKMVFPHYEKFASPTGELAQIMSNIRFETNDDLIRGKANIAKVMEIAKVLKKRPDILVYIEGHCDKRGTASYNLSLGSRRAASIQSMLVEQGIDKDRIATISFGKERPVKEGDDESAWSFNRRGQFKVYFR